MMKLNDILLFFPLLLFAFAFWWFGVRSSGLFFCFYDIVGLFGPKSHVKIIKIRWHEGKLV